MTKEEFARILRDQCIGSGCFDMQCPFQGTECGDVTYKMWLDFLKNLKDEKTKKKA